MNENQQKRFYQKSNFWLVLIIILFIIKGFFLSSLFPFLQGQDEHKHFSRAQFLAEPKEKTWNLKQGYPKVNDDDLSSLHMSEEIINTSKVLRYDEIKGDEFNSLDFQDSQYGQEEEFINSLPWKEYNDWYQKSIAGGYSDWYYALPSSLIKLSYNQSIFIRFYLSRFASVILGAIYIFIFYLFCRKIGFSPKISLILTAILDFVPMFSEAFAHINAEPMRVLSYIVFSLGIMFVLKNGWRNWLGWLIILVGFLLGLGGKAIYIVMAGVFYVFLLHLFREILKVKWRYFLPGALILTILIGITAFFILPEDFINSTTRINRSSDFNSIGESLDQYFDKTAAFFRGYEFTYWGDFGSYDAQIAGVILNFIWIIELLSLFGLIFYFFRKEEKKFLPKKKFVFFLLVFFSVLQFAIRFIDWRWFDIRGWIIIGQKGRYFFPAFFAHLLLIFIGLGAYLRTKKQYIVMLKVFLVLSAIFFLYSIFNLIIPRYYL